jgi:hypothetical protein
LRIESGVKPPHSNSEGFRETARCAAQKNFVLIRVD